MRPPRDVAYARSLVVAAGLDWSAGWWGLVLADQPRVAYWVLAVVVPFTLAAGAIWWRRWCGWVLFASASIAAISQIGAGGWRIGVALIEVASATFVLTAMSRPSARQRELTARRRGP